MASKLTALRQLSRAVRVSMSFAVLACDNSHHASSSYNARLANMQARHVVAGPGEDTFEQTFHVQLDLPIREANFLALLRKLKLNFEVMGKRGTEMVIPHPWHSQNIDLAQVERCYQIYGPSDPNGRSRKMYRAYVDSAGRVTYVENMFGYTGP